MKFKETRIFQKTQGTNNIYKEFQGNKDIYKAIQETRIFI